MLSSAGEDGEGGRSSMPDMVRDEPGRHVLELIPAVVALEARGGIRTIRTSEPAMLMAIPCFGWLDIDVGADIGIVVADASRFDWLDGDDDVMGDMSETRCWLTCETGETGYLGCLGPRLLVLTVRFMTWLVSMPLYVFSGAASGGQPFGSSAHMVLAPTSVSSVILCVASGLSRW